MTMSPAWASFIKSILIIAAVAVLSYLGDASHLNGILSPVLATIIASIAAGLEARYKDNTGTAFFGAVTVT